MQGPGDLDKTRHQEVTVQIPGIACPGQCLRTCASYLSRTHRTTRKLDDIKDEIKIPRYHYWGFSLSLSAHVNMVFAPLPQLGSRGPASMHGLKDARRGVIAIDFGSLGRSAHLYRFHKRGQQG